MIQVDFFRAWSEMTTPVPNAVRKKVSLQETFSLTTHTLYARRWYIRHRRKSPTRLRPRMRAREFLPLLLIASNAVGAKTCKYSSKDIITPSGWSRRKDGVISMIVNNMTMDECLALLGEGHVARLACANAGKPYVVPVHYVLAGRRIYSFSMPGKKISWMRDNPQVCMQHDSIKDACNWRSVVVHGLYRELPDNGHGHAEHMKAWELLQRRPNWWEPGSCTPEHRAGGTKPIFYFIEIVDITGRRALETES